MESISYQEEQGQEQESQQEQQMNEATKCSQCGSFPDDILMLACNHDLCLICSATTYQNEHPSFKETYLTCLICEEVTHLDHSSVYELEKISMEQAENYKQQQQNEQNDDINPPPTYESDNDINNISQMQMQQEQQSRQNFQNTYKKPNQEYINNVYSSNKNNNQNTEYSRHHQSQKLTKIVQGFCNQHPDEELSYFCFDCKCNCICSECVIHGVHRNHKVQTIKRAYPQIREKLQEYVGNLEQKTGLIEQKKYEFEIQKSENSEKNQYSKNQVQNLFQILRDKIDLKEQEVLQSCEYIYQENLKEIDQYIVNLDSKLNDLLETNKYINQNAKIQESINILNFYSANYYRLEEIVANDEYEKKLLQDNIQPNSLNVKEIENQIDDLCNNLNRIQGNVIDTNSKNNNNFIHSLSYMNNKYRERSSEKKEPLQQQQLSPFDQSYSKYDSTHIKNYIKNHLSSNKLNIENTNNNDRNTFGSSVSKIADTFAETKQKLNKIRSLSNHPILSNVDQNSQPYSQQQNNLEKSQGQGRYQFLTKQLKDQYEKKLNSLSQPKNQPFSSQFDYSQLNSKTKSYNENFHKYSRGNLNNNNDNISITNNNNYSYNNGPLRKKFSNRAIRTETYQ